MKSSGNYDGGMSALEEPSHDMDHGDQKESVDKQERDQMEGTALIPKGMFSGQEPKEGEEYTFKVVKAYGDEVEIAYAKGEEKKPETEGGEMSADAELDGMNQE